ncbi:HAMP domain-containing protein [Seinonella peptonophila]|uniref:histidine kinase n=1 Tax=Seinonella peptonophila TaxID=112248 RepID=A0A1M4Y6Y5_9BACL|nr:HAMP domain-containing sensor histidine kinase [Seinonella peptonophila]SHF01386.1 HAMP domain-containing protein [Seinonella peptonophila]
MRTLRIRKFTLLSLFFILTLPWLFLVATHFIETKTLRFEISEVQQKNVDQTVQLIGTNEGKWKDVVWQKQLQRHLQKTKMSLVIYSASKQEIFRSTNDDAFRSIEKFSVVQDGHILGIIEIYLPYSNRFKMIAAVTGLLLAFFIVGYEMRRFIIKPLEKMSLSAQQIARGDLDIQLPVSRITEIAEVRDGFKVMVKSLQESYQRQIKSEEERRFIIGAVAHDLRTPLFALRGYLEGLEQGIADSPEKMAKYFAVCKEKTAQLDRLVEDLFDYTKTEYLETEVNRRNVDLLCVIQKSVDSLSLLAKEKQILIHFAPSEDHCLVEGDSHLLERALSNILDNAVKHTPVQGEIFVRCYKDSTKVMFTILDTGPGFPSQEIKRVFEPLYRGEVSRNRLTGGTGLGLTIAQRIIRQHRGELVAENHLEGGALVTGWLPESHNFSD